MATDASLRGVYIPIITPFSGDGSVATDALEGLCHEYLDAGAAGIVALGTTGESTALDPDEKNAVIAACSKVCADRSAQLIVGAGTNNTRTTRQAVKELAGTPALVATLAVVPYYVRPSEAGIVAHFNAVAEVSPVPLVVYNIPARTGRNLSAQNLHELARTPNFAGVKQAPAGLDDDTLELLRLTNPVEGFAVLGGTGTFLFPLLPLGAAGPPSPTPPRGTERVAPRVGSALPGKVAR